MRHLQYLELEKGLKEALVVHRVPKRVKPSFKILFAHSTLKFSHVACAHQSEGSHPYAIPSPLQTTKIPCTRFQKAVLGGPRHAAARAYMPATTHRY